MKFNKVINMIAGSVMASLSMGMANAATWDITVTNLTNGNVFTPLYLQAHHHDNPIYKLGDAASSALEVMAECGDLSLLVAANAAGEVVYPEYDGSAVGNGGATLPGASQTGIQLVTDQDHLSVVAMILPTNDAFVGMNQHIPAEPGTYTYFLAGYDAGTESNTEVLDPGTSGESCQTDTKNVMPGDPGGLAGTGGTGVTTPVGMTTAEATPDTNPMIHVHRGALGDADAAGGKSDLNNTVHRWQNPVAKVVVTVTR